MGVENFWGGASNATSTSLLAQKNWNMIGRQREACGQLLVEVVMVVLAMQTWRKIIGAASEWEGDTYKGGGEENMEGKQWQSWLKVA